MRKSASGKSKRLQKPSASVLNKSRQLLTLRPKESDWQKKPPRRSDLKRKPQLKLNVFVKNKRLLLLQKPKPKL